MLVGHNSGLQELAVSLAGSGDPNLIKQMRDKFPTSALAVLEFNVSSWTALTDKSGHLRDFIKPKDIDIDEEELDR